MELFVSGWTVVRDASQQHNEILGYIICWGNSSFESTVCSLQVNT
jgi:hypothetical protein